ncbi:capsular polysaccharide synthesis protein [Actinoplanes sp. NPDC051861]|uniref:capsular polysaccharide synthesis protein n=1 Tax=Actinoplanes sp. NPDC051861 TaxID=3155170 RepID=UPI0034198FB3
MTTAISFRARLARLRAAAGGGLPAAQPSAPSTPAVVNLVPDPGFRGPLDRPFEAGGIHVHAHNSCESGEVPGRPGTLGVRVEGVGRNNDTFIAPGGHDAPGAMRLGMRAGATYTASVSVFLPAPLTGALHPRALRLVPGCVGSQGSRRVLTTSPPARNEHGHHRISVTFTVPVKATSAWISLHSGMAGGGGAVHWYDFALTETSAPVEHFDGATAADGFHTYEWLGEPNASPSRRTLRVSAGATPAEIAAEAVRLARAGSVEEARHLQRHVAGDRLVAARIALAEGQEAAAVKALRRVVKAGDQDGSAAYELGLLALAGQRWTEAEQLLREAVAKQPESWARGYALASAYDRLKRPEDSKRVSAAALQHDNKLPFDGAAVLELDPKNFGARRELGVFLAENLAQIRVQAEQRLASPVVSTLDQPIFMYWAQGFTAAPPVVQACLAALKATNPGSRVHEITDANMRAYVDVPEDLAVKLDRRHLSDVLRLSLLEKFGGVWVDATCHVTEPLRPRVDAALAKSGMFAFNYTGPFISNWFLAARPDSHVLHLWRAAALLWWERCGEPTDHFLYHHIFEMLHHLDERFRLEWDEGMRLNAKPPHALQAVMLQPYDPDTFQMIREGAFAHKLQYKYPETELTSESYLARIIRSDLP